jgi:hypothetical protein
MKSQIENKIKIVLINIETKSIKIEVAFKIKKLVKCKKKILKIFFFF